MSSSIINHEGFSTAAFSMSSSRSAKTLTMTESNNLTSWFFISEETKGEVIFSWYYVVTTHSLIIYYL